MATKPTARRRQRGTTLLESLVAFLVLSLGMLTVARVQTQLRLNADVARQRSEAVRLGQEELENLRAFSVMAAAAGARSYADIANATRTVDATSGYASNTRYVVTRTIDAASAPLAKTATVGVGWTDRSGSAQQVVLNAIVSGSDPAYSGALGLAPSAVPVKAAFGRSVRIPLVAKDLGNGSSAFKPVSSGGVALVFNNASGLITSRCTGIDPALQTRDLSAATLVSCDNATGYLLSGVVRFTQASPADPAAARDAPLAFDIALALTGGAYARPAACATEAMKTVSYGNAGGLHVDAVPIAATPASLGLAAWTETGDRYATYHCAVYPMANGQWSGRSTLVTSAWAIGTGSTDRRVCRQSADLDASGAIDTNIEHPSSYSAVTDALANQNFLVVKGSEPCPTAAALSVQGLASDVYADLSTAQHQPP